MAITTYSYNDANLNLIDGGWTNAVIFAQLLSSSYTFTASHATRADISTTQVSTPVGVSGKTLSRSGADTILDCNDIDFASIGTQSAAFIAIGYYNGSAQSTDKLLFCLQLTGDGSDVAINAQVKIATTGLYKITRAS